MGQRLASRCCWVGVGGNIWVAQNNEAADRFRWMSRVQRSMVKILKIILACAALQSGLASAQDFPRIEVFWNLLVSDL
jgi:hypothetical protein